MNDLVEVDDAVIGALDAVDEQLLAQLSDQARANPNPNPGRSAGRRGNGQTHRGQSAGNAETPSGERVAAPHREAHPMDRLEAASAPCPETPPKVADGNDVDTIHVFEHDRPVWQVPDHTRSDARYPLWP